MWTFLTGGPAHDFIQKYGRNARRSLSLMSRNCLRHRNSGRYFYRTRLITNTRSFTRPRTSNFRLSSGRFLKKWHRRTNGYHPSRSGLYSY